MFDRIDAETCRSNVFIDCTARQSAGAGRGGRLKEAIMRNTPWNKGRLTGQKRPLKPSDVWAIRVRLQLQQRARDLALFNLAIDSKLRGCDLVRLQVDDVCASGRVRDGATIVQKKTGRPVQFEITEQTRGSIRAWLPEVEAANGQYLFPSRLRVQPHLSTRQYARIVHIWCSSSTPITASAAVLISVFGFIAASPVYRR
jgi:integrase